jgi:hypothetical protein
MNPANKVETTAGITSYTLARLTSTGLNKSEACHYELRGGYLTDGIGSLLDATNTTIANIYKIKKFV